MTDNKVEQGYYQQFNNPNNQQYSQHPQQVNQNYQQTQPIVDPQIQQPYNEGYQPSYEPYNKQGGVYQPGPQAGYYNSNVNPLQQPYNVGISGSANPVQDSKEQYKGFYNVLWVVTILESLRFGVGLVILIIIIASYYSFFFFVLVSFLALPANLLVVLSAQKMIKGFQNNNAKPIRGGKPVMTGVFAFILISAILAFVNGLYFPRPIDWLLFVVLIVVPEILLAYIIEKCDQVVRLLEGTANLKAGPQVFLELHPVQMC